MNIEEVKPQIKKKLDESGLIRVDKDATRLVEKLAMMMVGAYAMGRVDEKKINNPIREGMEDGSWSTGR